MERSPVKRLKRAANGNRTLQIKAVTRDVTAGRGPLCNTDARRQPGWEQSGTWPRPSSDAIFSGGAHFAAGRCQCLPSAEAVDGFLSISPGKGGWRQTLIRVGSTLYRADPTVASTHTGRDCRAAASGHQRHHEPRWGCAVPRHSTGSRFHDWCRYTGTNLHERKFGSGPAYLPLLAACDRSLPSAMCPYAAHGSRKTVLIAPKGVGAGAGFEPTTSGL